MLKIQDKEGKVKYIWSDEADEPISIDDLILKDDTYINSKENKEYSNGNKPQKPTE